ncbi:DUF1667 domain-containing protein [Clostridium baratii]|uniref:DUF1667 domain-containing protein n=1 Tax=Clostridium nitritogenes TaxID=83340 RepID=A0ABN1LJM9_9CLOT|nr:DUF1667 domain-containing protein [Clostridium baratii]AQM60364.1 hypothetical protein NPD11_2969 [Clostridium baratii]KJU70825.1 hypothetical protein UC77_13205 [Clostridium baratii]MBS6042820.1 DUF1667 domain-containing protein [Clostridium baratii]MBT9832798.1 DUF1667 domain-containing protein [Clostridium baratii]MDY3208340.1 DUF1667 domain-containing protein [Clostridium baratii]
MESINLVCLACDRSCNLNISLDKNNITSVAGNACRKGISYAKKEYIVPSMTVTTVITVLNGSSKIVPVKSEIVVPKSLIFKILSELRDLKVSAPIKSGDIVKENILNTGVNIIATNNVYLSK